MKPILAVLAVGALALSSTSLRADLLGTNVTGTLRFGTLSPNFFDPGFGYVPHRFGNSTGATDVTIGRGVEFGYRDGANRDTANFTARRLIIRDLCLDGTDCEGNASFTMTFADPAFATARLMSNNLGVTFNLTGDLLTIDYPGGFVPDGNATAIFRIGSVAPTPEPGTIGLVATGILGAAGALRRRFLA